MFGCGDMKSLSILRTLSTINSDNTQFLSPIPFIVFSILSLSYFIKYSNKIQNQAAKQNAQTKQTKEINVEWLQKENGIDLKGVKVLKFEVKKYLEKLNSLIKYEQIS
jgi:hypothetical protein